MLYRRCQSSYLLSSCGGKQCQSLPAPSPSRGDWWNISGSKATPEYQVMRGPASWPAPWQKGTPTSPVTSLAHLKLRILDEFRTAKETWSTDPTHRGAEEVPPPPPKKSCLDKTRNVTARTAAQIRTGHCRSAVFLKRNRQHLLVLRAGEDDSLACPPPLLQCQTPGREG